MLDRGAELVVRAPLVVGLVARVIVLGFGGWWFGPIASPIALALAEAIQLGCWARWRA